MSDDNQKNEPERKPYNLSRAEARALVEAGYMPLKVYIEMFPEPDKTAPDEAG